MLVNKHSKKLLRSTILLLAAMVLVPSVYAQTENEAATNSAAVPVLVEVVAVKPNLEEQIKSAREEYRQALEKYRPLERQYTVSIEQYRRLQTLTSLEEAVSDTRETTIARNDVLAAYLTLLQFLLQNATGIEITQKDIYLSELSIRLDELSRYRNSALGALDRPAIEALDKEFILLGSQIETTAYQVQTLLAIGKLQTVYDQAAVLADELSVLNQQQTDELIQAKDKRAIQEIQDTLTRTKLELDQVIAKVKENNDQDFSRSNYTNFTRQLNTVYANLTQVLGFIAELTTGK